METMELYLHLPFCKRKCAYCDFLSAPADEETITRYVRALQEEIRTKSAQQEYPMVSSLFLGGGTPSFVAADLVADLMDTIRFFFHLTDDCEITMEANPGTLTKENLAIYKKYGINRISLGLQSANDEELKKLGRIHTYRDFLESYDLVRKAGFSNVNIDLMSGLPGQTLDSWKKTLAQIVRLRPEHISAYSLQIEEGTEFGRRYAEDEKRREQGLEPSELPSEELDRAMYMYTREFLDKYGYQRYEISNYARPGKECRHNDGYWTGVPYLGLGLGASSYMNGYRYKNESDLVKYISNAEHKRFPKKEINKLGREDMVEEFMFLGLRRTQGVERAEFKRRFGVEVESYYGDILPKLYAAGMLTQEAGRIFLTEEGIDVSNMVLSEFIL